MIDERENEFNSNGNEEKVMYHCNLCGVDFEGDENTTICPYCNSEDIVRI